MFYFYNCWLLWYVLLENGALLGGTALVVSVGGMGSYCAGLRNKMNAVHAEHKNTMSKMAAGMTNMSATTHQVTVGGSSTNMQVSNSENRTREMAHMRFSLQ